MASSFYHFQMNSWIPYDFRSLNSTYLVGVLDICMLDDVTCCLIMELCDGDLEYHIKNNSNEGRLNNANLRLARNFWIGYFWHFCDFSPFTAIWFHPFRLLIDNIARGYKGLFDLKIVHRDIKPQNILIKYLGKSKQLSSAKITDFGKLMAKYLVVPCIFTPDSHHF